MGVKLSKARFVDSAASLKFLHGLVFISSRSVNDLYFLNNACI